MALTACGGPLEYRLPRLNEADQQRLVCPAPEGVVASLDSLPAYRWLTTSGGEVVETPDGQTWVSFASANAREGELLRRLTRAEAGERGHFECWDDLNWVADLWEDPDLVEGD